ncbi:MAG: hypothetical protein WAK00_15145 [Microbacterium sp.]|uniref:hypothetical protein n=1 Tax=Microbacterium sp. TaxID=51671 RepID=UPI003BB04F89
MPQNAYTVSPRDADFTLRRENALRDAHSIADSVLDANSRDDVIDSIVDEHAAGPVILNFDGLHAVPREQSTVAGQTLPAAPMPLRLHLTLPCRGAVSVLWDVKAPIHGGQSQGDEGTVYFGLDIPIDGDYAHELPKFTAAWITAMKESQAEANDIIAEQRALLREAVAEVVGVRHDRRAAVVRAAAEATIPLSPVKDASIPIPLAPTRITLQSATQAAAKPGTEAALSEKIADDLVDMIYAFGRSLERSHVTANRLLGEDEESIRDVLLFILNENWQGAVTGETFVGKGKTDILLRWKDRDAFIGECKFWKGEQALADGLTQLLELYTVWRATRVALILFIRDIKDVSKVIDKARGVITGHARFVEPGVGSDIYRLKAQHDEAQIITLNLVPVVLPKPV